MSLHVIKSDNIHLFFQHTLCLWKYFLNITKWNRIDFICLLSTGDRNKGAGCQSLMDVTEDESLQANSPELAREVLTPLHSWAALPTLELMSLWGCWPTQVQGLALKSILPSRSTGTWHHHNQDYVLINQGQFSASFQCCWSTEAKEKRPSATYENLPLQCSSH